MLTFGSFTGINNVSPTERMRQNGESGATPLAIALNVDIGLDGNLTRRYGYTEVSALCHKNIWQADGFMLATVDGGDLVAIAPGGAKTIIYFSLGPSRVWYCNLPDGRTTFSNGLICGITDGGTYTDWGVPIPVGIGTAADVVGSLFPGDYRYQITHVRLSDGLEGGPAYSSAPIAIAAGGLSLSGLPTRPGHKTNVYITSVNGGKAAFAGSTSNGVFLFTGANSALVLPCRTDHLYPAQAGTITAFWRGRVLSAVGNLLMASKPNQYELFDVAKDFKQFSDPITLIVPVSDGVYIGTTSELAFLGGASFDELAYRQVLDGGAVLGSGVSIDAGAMPGGQNGLAMMCIADGEIVAGYAGGSVQSGSAEPYKTDATEVCAAFREVNGVPQYIAVVQ